MAFPIRKLLLEIDFVNFAATPNIDFNENDNAYSVKKKKKTELDPELTAKFLAESVDDFWHTENDKLEFFQIFDDDTYFCQRSKIQYDFKTESSYYKTYSFTGGTIDQAKELYDKCLTFFQVSTELKLVKVEQKIGEIDKEFTFYEQRYHKVKRQKLEMLGTSDWRVLEDIEDSYPGEKDRWKKWRSWLRTQSTVAPSDERFGGSGLAYFKYTYELKFPLDPKNYLKLYPNEMLEDGVTPAPAYMDENDPLQWVRHDVEASSDFVKSREQNMFMMANRTVLTSKKISNRMKEMMLLLGVNETMLPEDWEKYYVYDSELDDRD